MNRTKNQTKHSYFRWFLPLMKNNWPNFFTIWNDEINREKQSARVGTVPGLKKWQAAWRKMRTVRNPASKICPLRLAMGTPCFNSGTVSTRGLCFVLTVRENLTIFFLSTYLALTSSTTFFSFSVITSCTVWTLKVTKSGLQRQHKESPRERTRLPPLK